jgi:hypothetical protein
MQIDPLEVLPDELFLYILSFLKHDDVSKSCIVSKSWNRCANDSFLWNKLVDVLWEDKGFELFFFVYKFIFFKKSNL